MTGIPFGAGPSAYPPSIPPVPKRSTSLLEHLQVHAGDSAVLLNTPMHENLNPVDTRSNANGALPSYTSVPQSSYSSASIDLAQRDQAKQAIRDARSGRPPRVLVSSSILDEVMEIDGHVESRSDDAQRWDDVRVVGHEDVHDQEGLLPEGMAVKDALAQCEDPQLGWSLQFWITIEAPVTGHVFYACPATGQTSWTAPTGVFVVPRQPEGEWWELADTSRGNRSYFYNTLTKITQWTRPDGDAFVIPLGLIQTTTLPERPPIQQTKARPSASTSHLRPLDSPSSDGRGRGRSSSTPPLATIAAPHTPRRGGSRGNLRPPPSPLTRRVHPLRPAPNPPNPDTRGLPADLSIESFESKASPPTPPTPGTIRNRILSVVGEEMSGNEADDSVMSDDTSVPSWAGRREVRSGDRPRATEGGLKFFSRKRISSLVIGVGRGTENLNPLRSMGSRNNSVLSISAPSPLNESFDLNARNLLPLPPPHDNTDPLFQGPIAVPVALPMLAIRTKRLSTGLHPLLPMDIHDEILAVPADSIAAKQFAIRRAGIRRQRVPIERVLQWQKDAIGGPLLEVCKPHAKEAVMCFKVIQRTMGDRDKVVGGAKPLPSSASASDLASALMPPVQSAETRVLNEVRWMIQTAVRVEVLRDEVYAQLVKQSTRPPKEESVVLGFQLFCVLVTAFGPSKAFKPFVQEFLRRHLESNVKGVDVMAKYCLNKLDRIGNVGVRARVMTVGEIEHASNAAFYPSIYGDSLDAIMYRQASSYPSHGVPVILPFLAQAIIQLGGLRAEGIFRVPGDAEAVAELRSRMDRGHYQLAGVSDPHIASSLFKLFLRELEEPVIPTWRYNDALTSTATPNIAIDFVRSLPIHHRRVLVFVICFVRLFCTQKVMDQTKMTPHNLALVLAPNILRTTSDSLVTVYTNASYESRLIAMLLQHLDEEDIDVDDRPDLQNVVAFCRD